MGLCSWLLTRKGIAMFKTRLVWCLAIAAVVAVVIVGIVLLKTPGEMTAEEAKQLQQEQAAKHGVPALATLDCGGGVRMKVSLIPAGEFRMGSPDTDGGRHRDEGPQRTVRISKPFYLGATEVTQDQWHAVMDTEPWQGEAFAKAAGENAASHVSWDDATAFCKALAKKTGRPVRLPAEAEWEYACRAGATTKFSFGDDDSELGDHAWFVDNTSFVGSPFAQRVGRKKANTWGLYDMHGNVSEWCGDWYGQEYYAATGNTTDPTGSSTGTGRVLRGGCFGSVERNCRSAVRDGYAPGFRDDIVGFRVVVELPSDKD
jgi:formylglycine-generating enzyme required for sulfatase activity